MRSVRFLRQRWVRKLLLLGSLLLLLFLFWQNSKYFQSSSEKQMAMDASLVEQGGFQSGPCALIGVVDGRTLMIRQSQADSIPTKQVTTDVPEANAFVINTGRMRLIGLDSKVASSEDAKKLLEAFVQKKDGMLELDRRRLDKDGCLVGYVQVGEEWAAEEILRQGIAKLQSYPGDSAKMEKGMRAAQLEAKEAKRGVWGK